MKNLKHLTTVSVLLMFAACQPKEEFGEISRVPAKDVTITAAFEQMTDDATRTTMSSTGKVLWSAGDEVAILTEGTKDKFTLISGEKTNSAAFEGTITGKAPYYLLYPYSEDCMVADGKLKFKLPQEQTVSGAGTFGQGASPAVAYMSDYGVLANFKNLCGVLEISLCGASVSVSKIIVSDLNGDPLWGDCEVALDGKQGTDEQTMSISGGSNTVTLNLSKPATLKSASALLFDVVVPAGSLSKGFTVKIFDADGNAYGFLTAQTPSAKASRSKVSVTKKAKLTKELEELNDVIGRGYYKELFVNNGCTLDGIATLPSSDTLGWHQDYMDTNDSTKQYALMVGRADDLNGILLYPDNEPRYRMMYVNGGLASMHGKSLTAAGRRNVVTYFNNGGSYVSSCAGSYLCSEGATTKGKISSYFGIYPGLIQPMEDVRNVYTHLTLPENSPILKYDPHGEFTDLQVDSVRFNGGCNLPDLYLVPGAEVVARFGQNTPDAYFGKIACWAYKAGETNGRLVAIGGHPEDVKTGERLHLMLAMVRYATDGNGVATDKGVLVNGTPRVMDQQSTANQPENACIGDRQYHHFKLEIPAGGAKNFKLDLVSESGKTLMLGLRKGDFAWMSDADFLLFQVGCNKTLSIDNLPEGTWYVSVYGYNAPETVCAKNSVTYNGDISLLNGVPYSITASWE